MPGIPSETGKQQMFSQSSLKAAADVHLATILRATRAGLATTLTPKGEISVGTQVVETHMGATGIQS